MILSIFKDTKLLLILVLGSILRIWNTAEMNYHHDELSALLRCRFDSLTDLINFGVIPDGHPALTQVFLWFWTNLVGMDPMLVKLPFIVAGIVSIWLVFKLGTLLLDSRTGYVSATLFAVLQYAIVYSQWARPYAFGTLFLLLALFFLITYQKENKLISLLGFTISVALTAYTHYFALLTLLVFTFFYWLISLNRNQKLYVLAAGLGGFLFWVPHLSITLHHLSLGGIGDWLQTPRSDFWWTLIMYTFHYNFLFLIPIGFSILYYATRLRVLWHILPKRIVLFSTVVLTYILTYYYSVNVEALLHFGTMSFVVPLVCLLIGSLLYKADAEIAWIIMFSYTLVGVYSLIEDRDHFQLNYQTAYGDSFEWSQKLDIPLHFDLREDAVLLLQNIGEAHEEVVSIRQVGYENWSTHLKQSSKDTLLVITNPGSPPEILAAAVDEFPCLVEKHEYHTTATYLLARSCSLEEFESTDVDRVQESDEYSTALEIPFQVVSNPQLVIIKSHFIASRRGSANQLVTEYKEEDGALQWRGTSFHQTLNSEHMYRAVTMVDSRDLHTLSDHGLLKSYVWNRDLQSLVDVHISMSSFETNMSRYRLFEE